MSELTFYVFFKVKSQIFVRNHLTVIWEGKQRHSLTRMKKENKFGILYLLGIVERENEPETKARLWCELENVFKE